MELIVEELIKERTVDDIHPLGNRINSYINWNFANSWRDSVHRELADLTWGSYPKDPALDSEITRSSHIPVVSTS